ncbi:hypothetical protein OPT61_g6151 [Boeremia exigua]|uniref:Uncharacterized protein n=1 Tax=Boeremia exigua TaxID=749465 RepID=A0ACC2I7Q7_9PLEO|nr:hypothetical protein OPT61_g6151 [Boeremia exigua]
MASITSPNRVDLPTPPASSVAASQHPSPLPQPRKHPLQPGGTRESELIRYLDHGLNQIQKRVDNRVTNRRTPALLGQEVGYHAFWEVAKDLDGLVDVVWVSGSPNLQIPYLLNIAVLTADFLPHFHNTTRSTQATFKLLAKLDYAFSSLLTGHDTSSGETLPGFETGRSVATTDKVRLKGIVDRTRLTVVRVLSGESVIGEDEEMGEADAADTDTDGGQRAGARTDEDMVVFEGFENNEDDDEDEDWEERNIGNIYEKTIGELGDVLGGPPIGIITDDCGTSATNKGSQGSGFVEPDELEAAHMLERATMGQPSEKREHNATALAIMIAIGSMRTLVLPQLAWTCPRNRAVVQARSMPTYHACNITVRLGSVPLAETTTSDVVLRKGDVAKRQCETAEKKLLHSSCLKERRVLFPGDPDGFELNWLGNTPFMQVQVDDGFARPPAQDRTAQALALHVKLSDKALHAGFTGKTHLKIDVFFNGQLSACSLIHTNDIRSGAKSLHQVFAGYRVDFLSERPWVMLPPFMTADGGTRRFRKTITPQERFKEISAALLTEAEERGTDKDGASPPSAVFLDALARMQIPSCVMTMQKPGGRKFGVVDVVITAGTGNKITAGANYLQSPQRLKDSSFVVRARVKGEDENAMTGTDDIHDAVVEFPKALTRGLDDGTDAAVDLQSEHSRKRQAVSSVEGLPQRAPQVTFSQSPFSGLQVPYLPPPDRFTYADQPLLAGRFSPRCPSPEHRSDGHKKPLPSTDYSQTCDTVCGLPRLHGYHNDASCMFPEYRSPPSSLHPNTLHTSSLPIRITSSDSMPAHTMYSDPPFLNPASTSGSSPIAQDRSEHSYRYPQPVWSGETDKVFLGSSPDPGPGPFIPYVAPVASMFPAARSWSASPNLVASPYCQPQYLQRQAQSSVHTLSPALCMPPDASPPLPHTPFSHPGSAPFATPTTPSTTGSQTYGALPPTAMFSVPSKVRRNASPTKKLTVVDPEQSRSHLLIKRLVITGLRGRLLVDHCWKVAQCVVIKNERTDKDDARRRASTPGSEYEDPGDRSRVWQRSLRNTRLQTKNQADSLTKKSQCDGNELMRGQRRDSLQDGQSDLAIRTPLPYLKRHQGPVGENPSINPQIDVPDNIAPFVSTAVLTTATSASTFFSAQTPKLAAFVQPTAPQNRASSRSLLPGVQGPKAATFLFDDPEEVLREATRMRRSRSPTKPAPCTPTILPAQISMTVDQEGPETSSPLSSVPCSPSPERSDEAVDARSTPLDQIPQLDGSPERATPATSKKPFPFPALNSQPIDSNPSPSVSPITKKRKFSHQPLSETPRSPSRLKTVNNPPLNDDCVIAFAESTDKGGEKAVLRQVRGERQGVFKEEYVVLAVRFFIPGG